MIDDELVRLRRSGISGQKLHVASTCPMHFLKRPSASSILALLRRCPMPLWLEAAEGEWEPGLFLGTYRNL